jgi:hypothetical protein
MQVYMPYTYRNEYNSKPNSWYLLVWEINYKTTVSEHHFMINKISSENENKISTSPGQIVHQDCIRDYTSSRSTSWTINSTEEKEIENERDLGSSTVSRTADIY